jgi:hypothetical protein
MQRALALKAQGTEHAAQGRPRLAAATWSHGACYFYIYLLTHLSRERHGLTTARLPFPPPRLATSNEPTNRPGGVYLYVVYRILLVHKKKAGMGVGAMAASRKTAPTRTVDA